VSARIAILCLLALLAGGCALRAEEPPEAVPQVTVPELVDVSDAVAAAEHGRLPPLARDSAARRARRITVRVRNLSCQGVALGSGVALGPDLLMTNRHVLVGAEDLEVSTWNGRTFDVSSAQVGVLGDIGLVRTKGRLPLAGAYGRPPRAGDPVTAVGYPRGGPLTLSEGEVVDRVDGDRFGVPGTVVRLTAAVRPGNSGGPLLDRRGRISAIVYAIERRTGFGLAIPVDTLRRLERIGGFEAVPTCGEG
jgi:S1-C subfamily serine protease